MTCWSASPTTAAGPAGHCPATARSQRQPRSGPDRHARASRGVRGNGPGRAVSRRRVGRGRELPPRREHAAAGGRVTIRVLLVDDQDLVRAGFAMVLGSQPDLTVAGEAGDGAAAIRLAREVPADVMVMDVRMPGLDGVAATREICQAAERPRVLILTTFDLDEYAFEALRAGASGFLLKSAPPEELLYAIRSVHNGDSVVAPSTTRRLIGRFLPHLPGSRQAPAPEDLPQLTAPH